MTFFDGLVLAVMAISILLGGWRGFVSELLSLLAWGVAFVVTKMFAPELIPLLPSSLVDPLLRALAAYVGVFLAVLVAVTLLRWLLREALKVAGLSVVDRMLGAVFGVVRGLAIVLIAVAVAGMTKLPQQAGWKQAVLSAPLETMVMALLPWMPSDVAKRIRFK